MSPSCKQPIGFGRLEIIVGAMTAGAAAFLVVAVVVHSSFMESSDAPSTAPLLSYVALGYAVLALLVRTVVPGVVAAKVVRRIAGGQPDADAQAAQLKNAYATKTIIAAALIEGAALFAGVVYLVEGTTLSLALAAVLIVLLAAHFPRQASVDEWLERQTERLVRMRQFGA